VKFTDSQLQRCYENHFAASPDLEGQEREVSALIASHDLFQMLEGPHSSRTHELVDHLLLPELRPGLRRWYQRADANWDSAAVELRDQLSRLAGEQFEPATEIHHNPS
jgi:glucose-6-phosphate dehydrogenase assembly protein OpcA